MGVGKVGIQGGEGVGRWGVRGCGGRGGKGGGGGGVGVVGVSSDLNGERREKKKITAGTCYSFIYLDKLKIKI